MGHTQIHNQSEFDTLLSIRRVRQKFYENTENLNKSIRNLT